MSERAGVFVDWDYADAMTRLNESPDPLECVSFLQRRYHPPRGVAVYCSGAAKISPRIIDAGQLSYVNLHIIERKSADVALAVAAMRELPKLDRLVLLSGDSDFVPLIEAAREADVKTTVVAPLRGLAVRLKLAADTHVHPSELFETFDGLIRVGDGPRVTAGLALYFSRSKSRLIIIDNYMNDEVVRWAAAPSGDPKITLIGKSFDATAMSEASAIAGSGKTVTLIRHREIHDRWAVRDQDWLHSGHSFKDIGKKRSRLSPITNPAEIAEHEDMLLDLISTGEKVHLP